ncbi:BRO-N domain-containing protein [Pseudomonas sp. TUM22785]|uniref:BRO-N domain-containing protein n=1 Tax=Pseudomonas sp. TUM22785 TaxID=3019098 RepID=UPI002306D5D7|nr:Bro-N domain-containing protein [Pseudomonas sp. TUM22785]WCD83010.1 Bro-N domain-containing protein [Pseudomonas sp. TUM22785]
MTSLSFHNTQFEVVDRNGAPWLQARQIGAALGYAREDAINKIYERNADEFTTEMTSNVKLTLKGQQREVRIFSLRGAHLLAMFARTKVAKEFRHWVLDVLEGVAEAPHSSRPKQILTQDQQDAVKALVKARAESLPEEFRAKATIKCWSALKTKFGCTYKEIEPTQFTEAISLIARLPLEGELLIAEPEKVVGRLEINYSLDKWIDESTRGFESVRHYPVTEIQIPITGLYGMDSKSPIGQLLYRLSQEGYEVEACELELHAMKAHMEALDTWIERTARSARDLRNRVVRTACKPRLDRNPRR